MFQIYWSRQKECQNSGESFYGLYLLRSWKKNFQEEQNGKKRAGYGKYLLKELSDYLSKQFGKGFSVTNLKQMRQFYLTYRNDQIGQKVSDQFNNLPTVDNGRKFFLSWSHYLKLMRIDNIDERHFYEIESAKMIGALRN